MDRTQQHAASQAHSGRVLFWVTATLRICFFTLLVLMILPTGSVDSEPLHLFSLCFFLLCLLTLFFRPVSSNVKAPFVVGVSIAALLAAWIGLQSIDLSSISLANPIWGETESLFGPLAKSISVAPSDTMAAMIPTLLPFIIFLTGLLLFPDDDAARLALRFLCLLGTAIALFGLVEFLLFPGQLLFEQKPVYLDSLTAVFVNRNTAATFLGTTLILSVSLTFSHIRSAGLASFVSAVLGSGGRTRKVDLGWGLVYAVATAIVFLALMLTRSRAGIAASLGGLAIVAIVLINFPSRSSHGSAGFGNSSKRRGTLWRSVAVIVGLGCLALFFAGQVLLRAQVQGMEDGRFCAFDGMVRLLGDNWLVGTGLGTFRDVYSPYRNPACGLDGIWTKAHDVYLEGWITLGLPFVLLAIAVLGALSFFLVGGIRRRRSLRWIPTAGLGILFVAAAHSTVDFSLQIPGFAIFWSAVLSVCIVVARQRPGKISGALRPDGLRD